MIKIFASNKMEKLVECLAKELDEPLKSALAAEIIVVQSAGMQKWLSLELARRHGICANCSFPFPNAVIDNIFSAFLADYHPELSCNANLMIWKIMEILPGMIAETGYEDIKKYLGDQPDQMKLFQLAGKIASIFEQYLIFRPELIVSWEEGEVSSPQEKWQSELWRKMISASGWINQACLRKSLLQAMQAKPQKPELLPERLTIFGISYLPPYHLEIFNKLSCHIPVNLFYLSPSQEFWADIKSSREIGAALQKAGKNHQEIDFELLHLDQGNSILASMGAAGRGFFSIIYDMSSNPSDCYEPPDEKNLLSSIQADIYYLRNGGNEGTAARKFCPHDDSIQVHSCHNSLREVEALYDNLLLLMDENPELQPRDILVMTPDIEAYAPYIEAVFDVREPKIPYSIADRSYLADSIIFRGFISLLSVVESRFAAADVLSLVENRAIGDKFSIDSFSLEQIRHWVEKINIRWGIDAAHRALLGLPEFDENSWEFGLRRLVLGYAMKGDGHQFYENSLPYDEIEGEQAQIAGRFLNFWKTIRQAKIILAEKKTLDGWSAALKELVEVFFPANNDYSEELYALRSLLDELAGQQKKTSFNSTVELRVIKNYLLQKFSRLFHNTRFMMGGVTFCAMLPMRSIPFSVVCLIGMNNDAFPRSDRKTSFDLMEQKKKLGDRSLRWEDRHLFLEALLSVRNKLIISYVGQEQRDNSSTLPSVLISELLDYIDQYFAGTQEEKVSENIVRKHYLHGFHSDYFRADKRLVSFSNDNFKAVKALNEGEKEERVFLSGKINAAAHRASEIALMDLILFYRNPAMYFLEKSLRLKIDRKEYGLEDAEPFSVDNLAAYWIKQELADNEVHGVKSGYLLAVKQAQGVLPVGWAGKYEFISLEKKTNEFLLKLKPYLAAGKRDKLSVDLVFAGCRLQGTICNVYEDNLIHYRPASLKYVDFIKIWIRHLLMNVAKAPNYPLNSVLIGEDKILKFKSVSDARPMLEILIKYFIEGQSQPLKYFPRSSWAYANELFSKKNDANLALAAARTEWFSNSAGYEEAESEKEENRICFSGIHPLDKEFERTAVEILGGLFNHLETPKV